MNDVEVSVIVPVYNVERFVERCIRSIMAQTYTDGVECIVVDDCTPDGSMSIVKRLVDEYQGGIQFRLLKHERNRGLAAVRNTGVNAARGEYIIHIDSDDYVEPDMLEKMYGKAREENADVVVADYWMTGVESERYCQQNFPTDNLAGIACFLKGELTPFLWNKLFRRKLYTANGIKAIDGLNYMEDMSVVPKLLLYARKIVYINQGFVHYVQYNDASYCYSRTYASLEDMMKAEETVSRFFKERGVYEKLHNEFQLRRLINWRTLIYYSGGVLQSEWNKKYEDVTLPLIWRNKQMLGSRYWQLAFLSCRLHMFPMYNLMRWVWRKCRKEECRRYRIYFNKTV